jgi:hypothetical protein
MGTNNIDLDFLQDVVVAMYHDIAQCYSVTKRQKQAEIGVIRRRFTSEGISFITKTLPRLGKAVDTALADGTRLSTTGWKTNGSAIPVFLRWLLSRVFSADGLEVDHPDPIALKHFSQLCMLAYKLEVPYAAETAQAVVDAFVQSEQDLALLEIPKDCDAWIDDARDLVTRVISPLDPSRIQPRHGPGSVATGEDIFEKTRFSRIYRSLERIFPFTEWFVYNLSHVADSVAEIQNLSLMDEATAKVVLVPKDSRGPRLISCEPLEIQWIQQGLGRALQDRIESAPFTRGHVNFTDQTVNRRLALEASNGSGWVTLDMKEASDRVSLELVERLFQGNAAFLEAIKACRSESTRLPNGTVLSLKKFAPMGSSLCFPVESLVFYALAVSAIKHTGKSWREARKSVYVYGDDIIVRETDYTTLLQHLPLVGLLFNKNKCCTARFYRESCGCNAYVGVDVTPTRLKTVWSHRRTKDPKQLISYVAFHNAMYGKGYFHTADLVRTVVEERYGPLPYTNNYIIADNGGFVAQTRGVSWVCYEPAMHRNRLLTSRSLRKSDLQYSEIRTWMSAPKKEQTKYDGYNELLRRFSDGYSSHGGVYALTRRNRLKRVWQPNW